MKATLVQAAVRTGVWLWLLGAIQRACQVPSLLAAVIQCSLSVQETLLHAAAVAACAEAATGARHWPVTHQVIAWVLECPLLSSSHVRGVV